VLTSGQPSHDHSLADRDGSQPADAAAELSGEQGHAGTSTGPSCSGRRNLGALYLWPELRSGSFRAFHQQRQSRRAGYSGWVSEGIAGGAFPTDDAETATDLVPGLVESVAAVRQSAEGWILTGSLRPSPTGA
jgi:hypothetical protein